MVKEIGLIAIALIIGTCGFAQDGDASIYENKKGLLRSGLGLKMGGSSAFSSYYASGDLEYYIDDKVSFEGESNYFLGNLTTPANYTVVNHHSILTGVNYHLMSGKGFDPYVGLKIGVGLSEIDRINHEDGTECYEDLQVDPMAAIQLGFNYYTGKYFHLFMETGYQTQGHSTKANPSLKLNEFNFKFGLGIHVDWLKNMKIGARGPKAKPML